MKFRPKLTLFIQLEDGLAVDAALSTETRDFLKKLVLSQEVKYPSKSLDGTFDESQKTEQHEDTKQYDTPIL